MTRKSTLTAVRRRRVAGYAQPTLVGAVALAAFATAAMAQAPDCTGISTVFNDDPNLVNELTAVSVASGLSRPVLAVAPPGDVHRLFIVEQDGKIRILKDGAVVGASFLDVGALTQSPSDGCGTNCEQGLLGLAFDPGYATNRIFYIYHTDAAGANEVLARYEASAVNPDLALPATRTVILTLPTLAGNHNGGSIAFSPVDGRLYIGTGDGGGACDTFSNGQDLNDLLGKMLRIDVSSLPYSTDGNPFDGPTAGADEIWSWGLRNPYRWSFDRTTGAIYIGDVGQGVWEEIDCEPAGTGSKNYGWVYFEGDHCPNPSCPSAPQICSPANYTPPIVEYSQAGGPCAVTGGYVYRGCRMPALHGTYFYSDFCAGNVESFRTDATCADTTALTRTADLNDAGQAVGLVSGYGEDARGEIYIVDRGSGASNGELFKILPELDIMEVSGANADQFLLGPSDWFWEDLHATSGHVITNYRVYRTSQANGAFSCKRQQPGTVWVGGDPQTPAPGDVFFYAVSALNPSGRTTIGYGSDGTERMTLPGLCM